MYAAVIVAASLTSGTITDGDPAVVEIVEHDRSICTGTVIAPNVVLTAAHCASLELAVGIHRLAVDRVIIHPRFEPVTLANDLALLVVARELGIEPVVLARAGDLSDHLTGTEVRLVGFGLASIEDPEQAKREGWSVVAESPPSHLHLTPAPSQPCLGDSGGPVFIDDRLVAVVSWGDARCEAYAYAQRIDLDDPFIDDVLAGDVSGCSTSRDSGSLLLVLLYSASWRSMRGRKRRFSISRSRPS
jgi:secreted trypsin-like serine protease